jgi:hypothetical protein
MIGRLGGGHGVIREFNDEDAWAVNNSGLSQAEKDRWNAMRAIYMMFTRR